MRTIIVILGSLLPLLTQAQTFLDDGNVWSYANICRINGILIDYLQIDTTLVVEENFERYYLKGDTIINSKTYKQLWGDFYYCNTEFHPRKKSGTRYGQHGYVMGMREETGKVYVNVDEYDKQLMMFSYEEQKWNLTKEDDEYVLYDFNSPSDYVIPEVGSIFDLIFPYPLQRMDYWDGIMRPWQLNLFYRDGKLEYKSPNFYPDPFFPEETADGIMENVKIEKLKDERAVFNLQGQRINGLLKGLNIVDGKKIFVK